MDQSRAIFFRLTPFVSGQDDLEQGREVYETVMEEAFKRYGAVPMRIATQKRYGSPDEAIANRLGGYGSLLRRIKRALDPHNIMNSGFSMGFYGKEE
jgi:FAD/FMN-containing dehydrogenase